jgi:hypothetical protein
MHRICTRSLKKKENKESIDYRGILGNLEYMFLFPISKEPKSFTLQLVVPIKEVGPKSKVERSRRLKEELVSYVNLMACHDFPSGNNCCASFVLLRKTTATMISVSFPMEKIREKIRERIIGLCPIRHVGLQGSKLF